MKLRAVQTGILLLAAAHFCLSPVSGQANTGAFSGYVKDDTGKPVPRALVIAYMRYSASGSTSPVLTNTESGLDGSYSFKGLEPGSYLICAQAEGLPLLNPCEWSSRPPAWNLRASESARVDVVMDRGVYLHFRVHDPDREVANVRQKTKANVDDPYEIALVTPRQSLIRLSVLGTDPGGDNLRVVVPQDSDVTYLLKVKSLKLLSSAGQALGGKGGGTARHVLHTARKSKVVEFTAKKN